MNVEQARINMVEQQVRTWDVLDQTVLDLMERAPRDAFVPEGYRSLAYADISVPLGHGESMMPPRMEARLLQALGLDAADRVLEIGTGSGFLTYLLAGLAGHVVSLELHGDLFERARQHLEAHGAFNVTLEHGDGVRGRPDGAPYDAIAVTGSVPVLEEHFQRQLSVGGRLFVVVGRAPAMEARLVRRTGEHEWVTESLFETVLPPLRGAPSPSRFVF
jgi:protein-L-isoaspartate(D-aspartate) O-methyltransferase